MKKGSSPVQMKFEEAVRLYVNYLEDPNDSENPSEQMSRWIRGIWYLRRADGRTIARVLCKQKKVMPAFGGFND